MDENTGKYKLVYGIHKGTLESRDSVSQEFDTYAEALESFHRQNKFNNRFGYYIWFAYIISPDGSQTTVDAGVLYR